MRPPLTLLLSTLAMCAAGLWCGRVHAAREAIANPDAPINLDAASSDFDYRNNVLVFRKVKISQGGTSVAADEATATGLNFENSEWKFTGNVHIQLPDGLLESTSARVRFANNLIASASIAGDPATFEQKQLDTDDVARGRAGRIDYDIRQGTVRLTDHAWLSDGRSEITGETLVYNIREERVLANPGEQDGSGVSITINPRPRKAPDGEP
jgi:lipopolysaccharide transport protein LptA